MTEIGAVLAGKYRVLAKLGEGGMGSVYRAENQLTGKQVALKCMHAHASASSDSSERLLREARAASSLSHPNVVDVYDIVRDGETLFLVMELLQGQTLGDYLIANPQPTISEFLSFMLPAMAGVAAAHARGVIHRDLKPDNIFLAKVADLPNAVVKVLDFGIAKLAVARGPTLTQTGMSLGTPLYMSLEQLRGDKDVDQRTDVYAFGVMLYEAMTGSLPYEADTLPELAIKVATTDPRPVQSLRRDLPTALARVVDRAVARDRDQRIGTVRQLQQELDAFSRDHNSRGQATQLDGTIPHRFTPDEPRSSASKAAPNAAEKPAVVKAPRPAAKPAASAQPSLRAEPDTFRVREVLASVRPTRARKHWTIGAAGVAGVVSLGFWLLGQQTPSQDTETTVAPAARVAATLPFAAPNPLSAPGTSLEPAEQADVLPADEALPQESGPKLSAANPAPEPAKPAPEPAKLSAAKPAPEPAKPEPAKSSPQPAAAAVRPAAQPAAAAPAEKPVLLTKPAQPPSTVKTAPTAPAPAPAPTKKKTPLDLVGF